MTATLILASGGPAAGLTRPSAQRGQPVTGQPDRADDDWRNFRRRVWHKVAPENTRPRDLRSSYITVQVYAAQPLTTIAKWAGTSVEMIDRHYSGVIANWNGVPVPADEQIRQARSLLGRSGGRSVDGVDR